MLGKVSTGDLTIASGFKASAAVADIKGKGTERLDCALLMSDFPCTVAALFTSNIVKAAPVLYDMEILEKNNKNIRAIIVNSGNANACTGTAGMQACREIAKKCAKAFEIKEDELLIASTGVIGVPFPQDKVISVAEVLYDGLASDSGVLFAEAILTTDTVIKEAGFCVELPNGGVVTIGGCCKGAGMISPSLATMLCFITTDASIEPELLQRALREAAADTFNRVTVDGDMSTNDSIFVMANGASHIEITEHEYEYFKEGLVAVMLKLAKMIVLDGEGATRFVTIEVKNAATKQEALLCASKIANSPLVKTMFAGGDPNWGRLLSSAGASGAQFDPNNVDIYFEDLHYVHSGLIIDPALEPKAAEIMQKEIYSITIDLNAGEECDKYYTCDFTADYVAINADYRS